MSAAPARPPHRNASALDLSRFLDQGVRVSLQGGRTLEGVLKGYDQARYAGKTRGLRVLRAMTVRKRRHRGPRRVGAAARRLPARPPPTPPPPRTEPRRRC